MNLCIVIFSLAIMGYTTAFTPPFQATLPKARSAKSRVTMSMSSPGGNNDNGDGGGKTGVKNFFDAYGVYNTINLFVFGTIYGNIAVNLVMNEDRATAGTLALASAIAVLGRNALKTEPIESLIGTIQPGLYNAGIIFHVFSMEMLLLTEIYRPAVVLN